MGASVFEKHIGYEKQKNGFDIKFSTRGKEIQLYKQNLINAWEITKRKYFCRSKNELSNIKDKRSVFCVKKIKKGEFFSKTNIACLPPNIGLSPKFFFELINKKSKKNINIAPLTKKLKFYT